MLAPSARQRESEAEELVSRESFSLPAQLASVPALRVMLGGILAGFSRLDDVQVVAGEFAANAVREYCDCCPRWPIDVGVERGRAGVRLEVSHRCASTPEGHHWDEETRNAYTYGLALVRLAADQRGLYSWSEGAFPCRQTWWAQIDGIRP